MFRIDGSLFNFLSKIADFFIVNILTVVCSLPIVTIGAALTANYKIMQDIVFESDCTVINSYFRAFAGNFKQATVVWLLTILAFCILGADAYIVHNFFNDSQSPVMNVLLFVIGFAILGMVVYAFPLIARYDNSVKQHLQNAFILAQGNLLRTIIILLLYSIPVILGIWSATVLVESLGLWALIGFSLVTYLHTRLLKPIFLKQEERHEQQTAS